MQSARAPVDVERQDCAFARDGGYVWISCDSRCEWFDKDAVLDNEETQGMSTPAGCLIIYACSMCQSAVG